MLTDAVGKTLAYTTIEFRNSKGQIAARGSHTKYAIIEFHPGAVTNLDRFIAGVVGKDGLFVPPEGTTIEDVD